jgi:NAD(P)-dependent dehydrogenase (short-subunit alcohol dehydrogenase family)
MRLAGRIAAITGGGLGIGRATAFLFATEGATVAISDIETAAAEAVAKEIIARSGRAIAVGVDVGDASQVQAFVDRVVGEFGRLDVIGYNAAKAGVIELTKTMAVELAQHGIAVNAIAPAQIDTRLTRGLPEEARERRRARIPMGRFGDVDDVARAALFLASDDASFITGHTLAVDGGYLAGGLWSSKPR